MYFITLTYPTLSCSEMVSHYRNLYVENRADALEALDSLPQLKHAHSLKGKILFSMIVVSTVLYRSLYTGKINYLPRLLYALRVILFWLLFISSSTLLLLYQLVYTSF